MSRTILLPNFFFEEVARQLRAGNNVSVKVQGESMYPFLRSGDIIELRPYQGEDVPLFSALFYRWNGEYMTHRLVKKNGSAFSMLGDGNIYRVETISKTDIYGVLVSKKSTDGNIINCISIKWRFKGRLWYLLRFIRKVLIKLLRILHY